MSAVNSCRTSDTRIPKIAFDQLVGELDCVELSHFGTLKNLQDVLFGRFPRNFCLAASSSVGDEEQKRAGDGAL